MAIELLNSDQIEGMGAAGRAAAETLASVGARILPGVRAGHGIGHKMHMAPQVPHYGRAGRGLRLRPGMAFTIEPRLNLGTNLCVTQPDGWTVCTADGLASARIEHTIIVTDEGCEIMTRTAG